MASTYLSPGVYIEEVDRGSKPIEAVGTNTVGFLGESTMGPANEATLITNWSQFVKTFGDFKQCASHLAHAVYGFFCNGGSRCFVVNVGGGLEPAPADELSAPTEKRERDKAAGAPLPAARAAIDRDGPYVGKDRGPGQRTGIRCLDEVDEIAIVVAPGQTSVAVQDALLSHCENRKDRFAILDSQENLAGSVDRLARPRDSKYGAFYFPWIQVYDHDKGHTFVPPSGHLAGVYSRVDSERGVHKAPANEMIRGALGTRYNVSRGEQDVLNPRGINAIRQMNGAVRIWGARTLSSDASWKYVNVRRLFIMVEASVERATQWVVFEPNDHRLWKRVSRTITSFLTLLWRNGALMGTSAEQAFYVKCDEETNPPEVVDAGQLVVEIGLAPVKPAEFIVFRIGQMATGGGIEE